jgi:hypothetical protein
LKKQSNKVHRGELLKEAVETTRLNKEEVAAKAGYTRSTYYKHIQDSDLPYHILTAYGKAIHFDFTEFLPEMPRYIVEEPEENYNEGLTPEVRKQIDYWRNKYIDLLEKFNQLVMDMREKEK